MSCVFFGHGTRCTRSPRPVQMKNSHLRIQTSKCADASRIKLHWSVFFASRVTFVMCIYFFACGAFACVSTQVIFSSFFFCMRGGCLPHVAWLCCLSPLKGFIPPADREDLSAVSDRLSASSHQPRCGSLTQPRHVLFITCCHGLSEATMTNAAFLLMKRPCWRRTSNRHYHLFVGKSARRKIFKYCWEKTRRKAWASLDVGLMDLSQFDRTWTVNFAKKSTLVAAQHHYSTSLSPPVSAHRGSTCIVHLQPQNNDVLCGPMLEGQARSRIFKK